MMAAQAGSYKVEVWLEDVPGAEPRGWVKVKRPGSDKTEEISYRELLARPAVIKEDTAVKQEASRQYRALLREWKARPAQVAEEVKEPSFEITSVQADRAPWAEGFDQTRHMIVYYLQDGRERKDTPASLSRMIKEHPERFPADVAKQISMAVRAKVKSMEEQRQPSETVMEPSEPAPMPSPPSQAEQPPMEAVQAPVGIKQEGTAPREGPDHEEIKMELVVADPDSPFYEDKYRLRMTHPDGSSQVRGHDDLSKMVWRDVVLPLIREHEAKQQASKPADNPMREEDSPGDRAEVDQQACNVRSFKLLDVSKDEAGNLMIEAIIDGERKEWSVKDLEEEVHCHMDHYPPMALDILRDKVTSWKAKNEAKGKKDPVDLLLDLARQDGQAEFFHDPARVPFVRVENGDHHEVKAVREDFTDWLRYRAVKATGKAPKREPLTQAIDTMAVLAQFEGDEREVYIRKGENDGAFYYDLCNDRWQAIMITPEGWKVVDDPPVMFRRFDHMRPQVVPVTERPDALDELVRLINTSDEMRRLLKYHLTASQVPRINHYNAFFLGPQGSTKSTGNDIFKALDDPGTDNRDALPAKEDDLDLHLSKRFTAAYDNISRITLEVSDMLTRANSMSRSSRRALYTNNEENSRRYKTKIVLNAIDLESGVRPDLLDRTIIYNCEVVTEAQRMGQDEVNARIEELRPYALGACLDTLVKAMPIYHELKGRKGWSPRLKDAYLWMMAIAKVDGMAEADFEALFKKVIERRDSDAMEGDPLAVALEYVAARDGFAGTAGQLHEWLNDPGMNIPETCHIDAKDKTWPKSGIALGKRLPRIIAPLRSRGVFVYQCYHFEVGKNFTDKVRDLNWAKRGGGAYRDQDRMILIAKADLKKIEARQEA